MIGESVNPRTTRDFTVAVFVANGDRILLHHHASLERWLPPGGHIEADELPDEAAVREVLEETGVSATLLCTQGIEVDLPDQPRQLCRPEGVQLSNIRPGHEHIDLVYFATGEPAEARPEVDWFSPAQWDALGLTEELRAWCNLAIKRARRR